MNRFLLLLFTSIFFLNFSHADEYQMVNGREGIPIYRIRVPDGWKREEGIGDIKDTKIPIYTFYIVENDEKVRITLHNFPSRSLDDRIPPQAQINRWKGQIEGLEERDISITPQSFSGYVGFLFEGGSVMGWSMQLGAEQYRHLDHPEKRADITIKATGSIPLLKKNRQAIYHFARSFELIEEIPIPL